MSGGISYHASFECETTEEALALMKAVFGINERFGIPNGGGENEPSRALVATVGGDGGMGVDITSESKGAFRVLSEELASAGGMGHLAAVAYDAAEVRTETAEPAENPLTPREFSIQNPDKQASVGIFDYLYLDDFLKSESGSFGEYSLEIKFPTQALAENAMVSADTSGLKMDLTYSGVSSDTWLTIRGNDERVPLVNVVEVLKEGAGVECKMSPESFYESGNLHVLAEASPVSDGMFIEEQRADIGFGPESGQDNGPGGGAQKGELQVAFVHQVLAPELEAERGPIATVERTDKMGLDDFIKAYGDVRDGHYAMLSVWCKDMSTEQQLQFELERQYARCHPSAGADICDMGRMYTPRMADEFELFYGKWTPDFWKETVESLQNTATLHGADSMQILIRDEDVVSVINRQLIEFGEEYRLSYPFKEICGVDDPVRIRHAENDTGPIIPVSILEAYGVAGSLGYLDKMNDEYGRFDFDWEGINGMKIRLEDSHRELCPGSNGHDVYGHGFSTYRIEFRKLDPQESNVIKDAIKDLNLWSETSDEYDREHGYPRDPMFSKIVASADGERVSPVSTDPEAAARLGIVLKSRGIECAVSGAYTIAEDNELVLEVTLLGHENTMTREARPVTDGMFIEERQMEEPKLESFASAVEREQAEARKQQPTAPQRKNSVERNRGMDVAM